VKENDMKIALYIEDGLEQIVLTPESETEKNILGKLHDGTRSLSIKRGSFYGCQGGWVRQQPIAYGFPGVPQDREDASTMIVLREVLNEPRGLSAAEGPVGRRVDTPTPSEDIP
jgi:hypothetical protein